MASHSQRKRLKIVQAVHAFPPAIGGIETHAYNLSLNLAKQGNNVIVHTSAHPESEEIDSRLKKTGVFVKRHISFQFPGFSSVKIIPFLCIHLALENADIFHSHGFGAITPFQTAIAAFLTRKKFIWTIHGIPNFTGIKKLFLSAYSLAAILPLSLASNIICVSEHAKLKLPKCARAKATIIPNGISDTFFSNSKQDKSCACEFPNSPHKQKGSFKILFVGRLDKSKGIFMLAKAFNKFRVSGNSCLSYNGPDEEGNKEKLIQLAKENNFCIEFSHLPIGEMPDAYKSASVTVLPSEYEGFGLSVMESWASGTPAISTRVGIAPLFFKQAFGKDEGKFLFHDEHSLIQSLNFIRKLNPAQVQNYCKKAKIALKEYKWEKVAAKTKELYSRI